MPPRTRIRDAFGMSLDEVAYWDAIRVGRERDALRDLLAAEGYDVLHGPDPANPGGELLAVKHYERGDLEVLARWVTPRHTPV